MPITLVGYVSYTDDPTGSIFRKVMPEFDDNELDDPVVILRETTNGLDPTRTAIMTKYPIGVNPGVLGSHPFMPVEEAIAQLALSSPRFRAVVSANIAIVRNDNSAIGSTAAHKLLAAAALARINAAKDIALAAAAAAAKLKGANAVSILAAVQASAIAQTG